MPIFIYLSGLWIVLAKSNSFVLLYLHGIDEHDPKSIPVFINILGQHGLCYPARDARILALEPILLLRQFLLAF